MLEPFAVHLAILIHIIIIIIVIIIIILKIIIIIIIISNSSSSSSSSSRSSSSSSSSNSSSSSSSSNIIIMSRFRSYFYFSGIFIINSTDVENLLTTGGSKITLHIITLFMSLLTTYLQQVIS